MTVSSSQGAPVGGVELGADGGEAGRLLLRGSLRVDDLVTHALLRRRASHERDRAPTRGLRRMRADEDRGGAPRGRDRRGPEARPHRNSGTDAPRRGDDGKRGRHRAHLRWGS